MNEAQHLHRLTDRLDIEWQTIATSRSTLRAIDSWAGSVDATEAAGFVGLSDANDLVAATQQAAGDGGNQLLRTLVGLARHDELAGRIVLQRLLPGLVSAAAKYRFLSECDDPCEDAIGAAWIAVQAYDVVARPRHVAAALISDSIYLAFRRRSRRQGHSETLTEPHQLGEQLPAPADSPLVELAAVVRTAQHAGVPTHDLDLIRALVRCGSPSELARQQCVTPRTIRNRRDAAIEHIQHAVLAA